MEEDQLTELRKRVLPPWQVQRGTAVWAPWGKSGWSAVEVKAPQRKWAKGIRVKPHNGKEVSQGKVPLDRLLRRDPKMKGKDRPMLAPAEVFARPREEEPEPRKVEIKKPKAPSAPIAPVEDQGTHRETTEQRHRRLNPPGWKPRSELSKREVKKRDASIARLLKLIGDDATTDDW